MSSSVDDPGDPGIEDEADRVDLEAAQGTKPWSRALEGDFTIDGPVGAETSGWFVVDDFDREINADVQLVRSEDGAIAGACECAHWVQTRECCAHMAAVLQAEVLEELEVPVDQEWFDELVDEAEAPPAPTVVEEMDGPEESAPAPERAPQDSQAVLETAADVQNPIEVLPDWARTTVTHHGQEVEHLDKVGSQVIAETEDLRLRSIPVKASHELEFEAAVFRAQVLDEDAEVVHEAIGDAHIEEQNVAKWDLNRLAETRAKKRAVKWASGHGLTLLRADEEGGD